MLELARSCDRDTVERLARQVHSLHCVWRPDIYEMPDVLYPQERLEKEIRDRNLYVARLADTVVGYALIRIRDISAPGLVDRRVMIISEFCVEETLRGQGLGKEMASELRVLARAFRCTDLQLEVYPQNEDAVAFWQDCGFAIRTIGMQRIV